MGIPVMMGPDVWTLSARRDDPPFRVARAPSKQRPAEVRRNIIEVNLDHHLSPGLDVTRKARLAASNMCR